MPLATMNALVQKSTLRFFSVAILIEFLLAPLGMLVIWFFHGEELPRFWDQNTQDSWFYFGVGLAPCVAFVFFAMSTFGQSWPPIREIFESLKNSLGEELAALNSFQIFCLSLSAGVGEELLFRGAFQPLWGAVGTAIVFGLLHSLSFSYFAVSTLFGAWLGFLYQQTGNLLVPVSIHFLYDMLALLLFRRRIRESGQTLA